MSDEFKDYLGAIEFEVDGVQYEIGLRQEHLRCLRGLWTCMRCGTKDATTELKSTEGEAIELAKVELKRHHDQVHRTHRVKSPQ